MPKNGAKKSWKFDDATKLREWLRIALDALLPTSFDLSTLSSPAAEAEQEEGSPKRKHFAPRSDNARSLAAINSIACQLRHKTVRGRQSARVHVASDIIGLPANVRYVGALNSFFDSHFVTVGPPWIDECQ
jgi:hypothetical protein